MATTVYKDAEWISIRSREVCPICGSRKGRCSKFVKKTGEIIFYKCKYMPSDRPSKTEGWYLHWVNDPKYSRTSIPKRININELKPKKTISAEELKLWDSVYREMRRLLIKFNGSALFDTHLKDLKKRGLSTSEIENMEYFSIPNNSKIYYDNYYCKLSTAIVKELEKKFTSEDLIKVPGFSKVSKSGNDFVVFRNTMKVNDRYEYIDGYFIPYHNIDGLIVGMQYRLTKARYDEKGKKIRYLWYVTYDGPTCGSPIDHYVPTNVLNENFILITEGATKEKIAAEKLQVRALGEAGVGNYINLVNTLEALCKKNKKQYKVILALDMDKYQNKDVKSAEVRTAALLKSKGFDVAILEWPIEEGKGIDDKLLYSGMKNFYFLKV